MPSEFGKAVRLSDFNEQQATQETRQRQLVIQTKEMLRKFDLSAKEIADDLCVPYSKLLQYFKDDVGCSFSQYRADHKLSRIKRYLRRTNETVSDIRRNLGYTSSDSFSKFFAKHAGISIVQYRKKVRVERAKQLLSANFKISDIAKMVGLSSEALLQNFKRSTGMSPREWRTIHKSGGFKCESFDI